MDETFLRPDPAWTPFTTGGAPEARVETGPDGLRLSSGPGPGFAGIAGGAALLGSFTVELEFADDDGVALALAAEKDGRPDPDNITVLSVLRRDGVVHVEQHDRQRGVPDVRDPRGVIPASRYAVRLDGTRFSVPFTGTNGRIRIHHEGLSGTFHYYYGTRLERWGTVSEDWMELAPCYAWLEPGRRYFPVVLTFARSGNAPRPAQVRRLRAWTVAPDDLDDQTTGFAVRKRTFSWSGFEGEATVVSFGPEFPHDRNFKLVWWDRANNAPVWRLTNQHLLSFEFFESGDSVHPGCHEAMSDRQRHGQSVEILEDNPVRKVVRWRGVPVNPNYRYTGEGEGGNQLPFFEEIWTVYPDGTGTRQLLHYPKWDTPRRPRWGPEFIEFMVIGGSLVEAGDLCDAPALSILGMDGSHQSFHPPAPRGVFDERTWDRDQLVFVSHFKEGIPDFFLAYSQSDAFPETWSGIRLQGQLSWHRTTLAFSHWPVGREPFGQNTDARGATTRSYASHLNEVTHTSLVSAGFYDRGTDWSGSFRVDGTTGRPFRRHVMLVGVAPPGESDRIREEVSSWLEPGEVPSASMGLRFEGVDRLQRTLRFSVLDKGADVDFALVPGPRGLRNPALALSGWKGSAPVRVTIGGRDVGARTALTSAGLLIWIPGYLPAGESVNVALQR